MTRNKKIIAVIIVLLVAFSFFYEGNEEAIKVIAARMSGLKLGSHIYIYIYTYIYIYIFIYINI